MSHFTKIKTRFTSLVFLQKALDDLKVNYSAGRQSIRGFAGQTTQVDVKIKTNNPIYDIGFVCQEGSYLLVGDWYGLPDFDRRKFLLALAQRYAYHAAIDTLSERHFHVSEQVVEEDGTIRLLLRRSA